MMTSSTSSGATPARRTDSRTTSAPSCGAVNPLSEPRNLAVGGPAALMMHAADDDGLSSVGHDCFASLPRALCAHHFKLSCMNVLAQRAIIRWLKGVSSKGFEAARVVVEKPPGTVLDSAAPTISICKRSYSQAVRGRGSGR